MNVRYKTATLLMIVEAGQGNSLFDRINEGFLSNRSESLMFFNPKLVKLFARGVIKIVRILWITWILHYE